MPSYRPVVLIVLDGWGLSDRREGNAIALADTPVYDRLWRRGPRARLRASGAAVGLPEGQMGNSEVGHLNLGAGFVVDQDLKRIQDALADGTFGTNAALCAAARGARDRGTPLHLAGLVGTGGVHSHADHLLALVRLAREQGVERLFVHAFTDGRDTPPHSGLGFVRHLEADLERIGLGRVASVSGRYYSMERDGHWDRTAEAWAAMTGKAARSAESATAAVRRAYDDPEAQGDGDEFVKPTVIVDGAGRAVGPLTADDAVILFNFRADRVRQLLAVLTHGTFTAFDRGMPPIGHVATLTEVVRGQSAAIAFAPIDVEWPLARVVSERGSRQYHTAESEKRAHVTYFFNGGREDPFAGEDRHIVPSPGVATYDLQPEMSAVPVTEALVRRLGERVDDFVIVNYANPDMVGHTGILPAAVRAVEAVDRCLGRALDAVAAAGGAALVTSDHGNAETMIEPGGSGPHTAHTLNPVPLLAFTADDASAGWSLTDGRLCDVAPTLLWMMGVPRPADMTGRCLITEAGARRAVRGRPRR